jgi:nitrate/TMAO reductase-like tetraheme cytochrome c subunit
MKTLTKLLLILFPAGMLMTACEGPMGLAGQDANESCKECHNSAVVDKVAIEYEHSVHATGEAFEEGTRAACAPCHSHQGFTYVVKNNTPATFVADPANAGKFLNNYGTDAATASLPGPFTCFTCHDKLHTSYTFDDFRPLTTEAAVPMTMWGGSKTINFPKTTANLCAKCHQPRPVTNAAGNVIDYAALASAPTANYTLSSISYRTGVHYGTQAAIASGTGAVEFGTGYTNSAHATQASCSSCHMATPSGMAGGHSFNVQGNFNGCNVSGCHSNMSATNALYTAATTDVNTKLSQLATKINALGLVNGVQHDILQKDPSDNQYHGYIDTYDAASNPTGFWKNPSQGNVALPALTNAQFGAIINFQIVSRDGSHGVHNYPYTKKLLENTLAAW